jgi:4-hydroxy-3-polyprenylbenzoate decarboxylase
VFGVRILQRLRHLNHEIAAEQRLGPGLDASIAAVETHLVVSASGWLTLHHETGMSRPELEALADVVHGVRDVGASIASGSFVTDGMVIAPCSMKTLASVAHGFADNLVSRAADVILKERRRLVLLVRETPLNLAHLRNMIAVTEMGGIIFPPVPAFYNRPVSLDAMIDDTVGRVIDLFGLFDLSGLGGHGSGVSGVPQATLAEPWRGLAAERVAAPGTGSTPGTD